MTDPVLALARKLATPRGGPALKVRRARVTAVSGNRVTINLAGTLIPNVISQVQAQVGDSVNVQMAGGSLKTALVLGTDGGSSGGFKTWATSHGGGTSTLTPPFSLSGATGVLVTPTSGWSSGGAVISSSTTITVYAYSGVQVSGPATGQPANATGSCSSFFVVFFS